MSIPDSISSDFTSLELRNIFFTSYPSFLGDSLKKICSNSSVLSMLKKIHTQLGKIAIKIGSNKINTSEASWSWEDKTITLNSAFYSYPQAKQITSIIFELCNAEQSDDFKALPHEASTKVDDFVFFFEKLEHRSALKTKLIADQILDKDENRFQCVQEDFNLHYALQQISGHSEFIAHHYFPDKPYRGSLSYPLEELKDPKIRRYLYALLYYYQRIKTCASELASGSEPEKANYILERHESTALHEFNAIMALITERSKTDSSFKKVLDCAHLLFFVRA